MLETSVEPQVHDMALLCDDYMWAPYRFSRMRHHVLFRMKKQPGYSQDNLMRMFVWYYCQGRDARIQIELGSNTCCYEYGFVSMSGGRVPTFLLMRSTTAVYASEVLAPSLQFTLVSHKLKGDRTYNTRGLPFTDPKEPEVPHE
jgi:hypothetical protein